MRWKRKRGFRSVTLHCVGIRPGVAAGGALWWKRILTPEEWYPSVELLRYGAQTGQGGKLDLLLITILNTSIKGVVTCKTDLPYSFGKQKASSPIYPIYPNKAKNTFLKNTCHFMTLQTNVTGSIYIRTAILYKDKNMKWKSPVVLLK